MKPTRSCLYCYESLDASDSDFHSSCSMKMFDTRVPPELPYSEGEIAELAENVVRSQIAVSGIQPKLSVDLETLRDDTHPPRFTIVGLWGGYILKPPTSTYPHLPEVEDCTMHLAELAGIPTVPHSLIRMREGSLAYITRRIDRTSGSKLPMEDMCQITERLTEHKYRGSHEQIAKAILRYSANPLLDVGRYYEQVVFSFVIGNADMHLKNFSLIRRPGSGWSLAPAYDLVATALVNPEDREELALTLNGKKSHLKRKDFEIAMASAKLPDRTIRSTFDRMESALPRWQDGISRSFLPPSMKTHMFDLIQRRGERLGW